MSFSEYSSGYPRFCSDNQDSLPKFLLSLQKINQSEPHSCAHHPKTTKIKQHHKSQPQQQNYINDKNERKTTTTLQQQPQQFKNNNNNDTMFMTTTHQEQQEQCQQNYTTINKMTNEIASQQQHKLKIQQE